MYFNVPIQLALTISRVVSQAQNAEVLAAEQRVQRARGSGAATEDETEPRPGPGDVSRSSQAWQV